MGVPRGHQSSHQLLGNNKLTMTGPSFRKLFGNNFAPINVAFKGNNDVIQVQKVDQIQNLTSKDNNWQSSVLSDVFNVVDYRVVFDSTKEKSTQPSRVKPTRRDKAVAIIQVHGKHNKPALVRSPVVPGSFLASARGASRAHGPQEENGPKKRSRTEFVEEGDQGKEVQKVVSVFNNLVFFLKKNEATGPGHQACRDQ